MGYRRSFLTQSPRRRAIIIGAIVVAVIALGIVRYFSPLFTARSFLSSVYKRNYSDALNLVCADQRTTFDNAFKVNQIFGAFFPDTVDASQFTYAISSESLTSATITAQGTVKTIIGDYTLHGTMTLQASGLGWCVSDQTGG